MAKNAGRFLLGLLLSSTLLACAKSGFEVTSFDAVENASSGIPHGPNPEPPTPPNLTYKPLLWEPVRVGSKTWSELVFSLIRGPAQSILTASDFQFFCPNFPNLSLDEKINAAGMLISAMTKYESNHNPLTRFQETGMGTDPVTGLPVFSEGLLQLSYQDTLIYPFCKFDWLTDKNLSVTSPQKTILNPLTNLDCGVRILASQVTRKGKLILATGAYWAVIKSDNPNEKLDEIASLVQTLDFCQ